MLANLCVDQPNYHWRMLIWLRMHSAVLCFFSQSNHTQKNILNKKSEDFKSNIIWTQVRRVTANHTNTTAKWTWLPITQHDKHLLINISGDKSPYPFSRDLTGEDEIRYVMKLVSKALTVPFKPPWMKAWKRLPSFPFSDSRGARCTSPFLAAILKWRGSYLKEATLQVSKASPSSALTYMSCKYT